MGKGRLFGDEQRPESTYINGVAVGQGFRERELYIRWVETED